MVQLWVLENIQTILLLLAELPMACHPHTDPRFQMSKGRVQNFMKPEQRARLSQERVNNFFRMIREKVPPPQPFKDLPDIQPKAAKHDPKFSERFLAKYTTNQGLANMWDRAKKAKEREDKLKVLNAKRQLTFDTQPDSPNIDLPTSEPTSEPPSPSTSDIIPPTPPRSQPRSQQPQSGVPPVPPYQPSTVTWGSDHDLHPNWGKTQRERERERETETERERERDRQFNISFPL